MKPSPRLARSSDLHRRGLDPHRLKEEVDKIIKATPGNTVHEKFKSHFVMDENDFKFLPSEYLHENNQKQALEGALAINIRQGLSAAKRNELRQYHDHEFLHEMLLMARVKEEKLKLLRAPNESDRVHYEVWLDHLQSQLGSIRKRKGELCKYRCSANWSQHIHGSNADGRLTLTQVAECWKPSKDPFWETHRGKSVVALATAGGLATATGLVTTSALSAQAARAGVKTSQKSGGNAPLPRQPGDGKRARKQSTQKPRKAAPQQGAHTAPGGGALLLGGTSPASSPPGTGQVRDGHLPTGNAGSPAGGQAQPQKRELKIAVRRSVHFAY